MSQPDHSPHARENNPAAPSARPPGVLIVDDNDDVRRVLAAGLRHYGFAAWSAGGGREAVEVYRSHRAVVDVVLLDVLMPGLDGPGALAALREIDAQVRVCFMTGDAGGYSEQDLLDLGTPVVFRKPFHLSILADELARLTSPAPPTDPVKVTW
jgi:CheY-like chemotaxis protein